MRRPAKREFAKVENRHGGAMVDENAGHTHGCVRNFLYPHQRKHFGHLRGVEGVVVAAELKEEEQHRRAQNLMRSTLTFNPPAVSFN